jgi:hypothetical protein
MLSVVRIVAAPRRIGSNDPWAGIITGAVGRVAVGRNAIGRISRSRGY